MDESMYKFMKVGLIHFMAYPDTMKGEGPVLETVKKIAADDYFNAIEITQIKDIRVRNQVNKILKSSHMTVAFGGQPMLLTAGLNINDTDEGGRQKALSVLKEGIDQAYEMGAVGFAFLSGMYKESEKQHAYHALVRSTKELCTHAKSRGKMNILLEVFDYDIDKKSLIGPTSLAREFAGEMRSECDNFGLVVDLSHIPLLRETMEQAILPVKEYIMHAHMGNCVVKDPGMPAYGDAHPRFGFPDGENDVGELAEYLRILKKIGFLNEKDPPIVSFEVKPFSDEDPLVVIANAKRTLNLAWLKVS